jgi:RNA polymerase sigma-70 factor (ECF subfamily)
MTVLAIENRARARGVAPMSRIDRDGELVQALRRREATAAERLVTTYGGRAYRLAFGITCNGQDAEEVVQDALWAVVHKIDTFRGESAFGSWFYRIVTNAAYQRLRGRSARRADIPLDEVLPAFHADGQEARTVADWSASVDDPSRGTELRLVLIAAIDELPADYRSALVLHDVEGLSNTEVAQALHVTISAVKSRIHRARLFLRKQLATYMSARDGDETAVHCENNSRA